MKQVEILAPAGSFESMVAASNAGCDAVYAGGSMFGARAFAGNFDGEELLRAIDYMHLRDRKLYLTVNTLLKEDEITKQLYNYLKKPYEAGLDAVIVQDTGVLRAVHEWFPGLPIHASTQMTLTMAEGADALRDCGVTRLVPARELSLDELRRMRSTTDLEIETFIHGALCYCYSGQCLMSSMIGGRSGNRGRCAQPCRHQYWLDDAKGRGSYTDTSKYLLSPADLSALTLVPELLDTGIDSFKIEGRMKSPEYAAAVTYAYKEAVSMCLETAGAGNCSEAQRDKMYQRCASLESDLKELYNRGGFTTGYFTMHNSREMMSMERPNHNGVEVGEVVSAGKGMLNIRLSSDINAGDVLEVRQGSQCYEYTQKDDCCAGTCLPAKVYQNTRFDKGAKVFRTKNKRLLENIRSRYIDGRDAEKKILINGTFKAAAGEKISLALSSEHGEHMTIVYGDVPVLAENRPVDELSVRKQLEKLGDTPYKFASLTITLQEGLFISLGGINKLRRAAAEAYENAVTGAHKRETPADEGAQYAHQTYSVSEADSNRHESYQHRGISAKVCTRMQLKAVCGSTDVDRIYISIEDFGFDSLREDIEAVIESGKKAYLYLPQVCRSDVFEYLSENSTQLMLKDVSGYIVRNFEEYTLISNLLRDRGEQRELRLDYNMYVMNSKSKLFWREKHGEIKFTLPLELNCRELKALSDNTFEMVIYGRTALITSAQCSFKNSGRDCTKYSISAEQRSSAKYNDAQTPACPQDNNIMYLCDERHHHMAVKRICRFCMNIIYNSDCLSLLDEMDRLATINCGQYRLDFTIEDYNETVHVLKCLHSGAGRVNEHCTKGHFNRGIE